MFDGIEGKPTGPRGPEGKARHEASFDAPPEWAAFFETADRYERFESLVRRYFKAHGRSTLITDGVVTLGSAGATPNEPPLQMGLGNIAQACARADEEGWAVLIAKHFDGLQRGQKDEEAIKGLIGDWDWAREHLVVRLWEEEHVAERVPLWVTRHDVPGLVTVLSLDLPETVRTVLKEDTRGWTSQDQDEWFAVAIENVVRMAPVEHSAVEGDEGEIQIAEGESVYVASRLLRLSDFPEFLGEHGAFVSAPVRNVIVGVPFNDGEALVLVGTLMGFTADAEARGPGSVSRRVWWWNDGEFEEGEYEITDEGLEVYPGERLQQHMTSIE